MGWSMGTQGWAFLPILGGGTIYGPILEGQTVFMHLSELDIYMPPPPPQNLWCHMILDQSESGSPFSD